MAYPLMTNQLSPNPELPSLEAQAELDLLQALCVESESLYPWNPIEPESADYFMDLETQIQNLEAWTEAELAERSSQFFAQIDGLWAASAPVSLLEAIAVRFPRCVPHSLVETIVQQAQRTLATSNSLADQLVQCVQDLMPQWDVEDLQVLARPLAFSMRGSETDTVIESTLLAVRAVEWQELSEIEQARLSLAIARCTIEHLRNMD